MAHSVNPVITSARTELLKRGHRPQKSRNPKIERGLMLKTLPCILPHLAFMYIYRYTIPHRYKVGILYPAKIFRVGLKRARELSRAPAMNRVTDKLTRAHENTK